jgi:hypothetical protein
MHERQKLFQRFERKTVQVRNKGVILMVECTQVTAYESKKRL